MDVNLRKAFGGFLVLALALLFVKLTPEGVGAKWLGLLMLGYFTLILFIRAFSLWRLVRKPFFKRCIGMLRASRPLLAVPEGVRFLHVLGFAFAFSSVTATVAGYEIFGRACMVAVAVLLFVAGVADIVLRARTLLDLVWSDTLGKIFSVSIGASLTYLAISIAKHWIHSIAQIDPKYLTESTTMLAALLTPVVYFGFGIAVLALLALVQMSGLALVMFVSTLAQQFGTFAGNTLREKMKMLWYRLSHGKRPYGRVLPKAKILSFEEVSILARPLSTVVVVLAAISVFDALTGVMPRLRPYVAATLVAIEYRGASRCAGLDPTARVVYMDDNQVSVARREGNNLAFEVAPCKTVAPRP